MNENEEILKTAADPARRTFFKSMGTLGLGAAVAGMALSEAPALQAQTTSTQDTANQILLAALVAEGLASTFYYNGLVGGMIQDPGLAGPGGTALKPSPTGSASDISYFRAALSQEISHANLLRAVGNFGATAASDPYQTFYFPAGTFDTLPAFINILQALENAFIGAYLTAVREFSALAAQTSSSVPDGPYGGPYSAAQLQYFAQVSASIMGVECEHRVLGRDILGGIQANNLYYQQSDGLLTVYNGSNSAVAALTPFLTPATGPACSYAAALAGAATVGLASTGNPPAFHPVSLTASPNPIPVKGSQRGVTTISWNAPSSSLIQIRVNAPNGPIFTYNFGSGSMATGPWVTDGMTFFLQDASSGDPSSASNTLATVTLNLLAS